MGPPDDIRLSFNQVPELYDEIRPGYPAALFDDLFDLLPPRPDIVEVGAGTGQATRALLARGASVHAVEIGPATAAKLRANHPTAQLRITVGDFEQVDLARHAADALFSAAAYHWIATEAQLERPARFVRRGGVLAIVDLVQVQSEADGGFFAAAQPVFERHGQPHRGQPAPGRDGVDPPLRAALASDPRYGDVAVRRYDWDQTYTAADYRKLLTSDSGRQMMHPVERELLLDDIQALVEEEFGGAVTRPLVAALTTATLTS